MQTTERNILKIRMHDALVGVLYLFALFMTMQVNFNWIYMGLAIAILQLISPITKFCPVYAILNMIMPDTDPIQNGK